MNRMGVLFKELCDEDIAYVSGGISASSKLLINSDGTGTGTTTITNLDGISTVQTVTFKNDQTNTSTSSPVYTTVKSILSRLSPIEEIQAVVSI
jgi:hypothetical protein